jgi:hypothetical protein
MVRLVMGWRWATERRRKIEELGQQKGNGPRSFEKLKYFFPIFLISFENQNKFKFKFK